MCAPGTRKFHVVVWFHFGISFSLWLLALCSTKTEQWLMMPDDVKQSWIDQTKVELIKWSFVWAFVLCQINAAWLLCKSKSTHSLQIHCFQWEHSEATSSFSRATMGLLDICVWFDHTLAWLWTIGALQGVVVCGLTSKKVSPRASSRERKERPYIHRREQIAETFTLSCLEHSTCFLFRVIAFSAFPLSAI